MKRGAFLFLTIVATPAFAQSGAANPAVSSARDAWSGIAGFIIASAEQMPEANYSFRPVETVRTFGQLIGHVAGAQYMYCAAALGEAPKGEGDIEKTVTTKTGLVAAMKASTDYCKRAYELSDSDAMSRKAKLFGQEHAVIGVLIANATHDGEHYGNIVTYLRTKGMIPPSSQPRPGAQ